MKHLVAVYGSLKKGFGNHRLLTQSQYLRDDWVSGFTMYSLGGFPAIADGDGDVKVEIYMVDDETFSRLDSLEGYPTFYNRKKVSTEEGNAWIYFHDEAPSHAPVVDTGDWQ